MTFDRVRALLVAGDVAEAARIEDALAHAPLSCDVERAQTLAAALDRLGAGAYDVVLVDLDLSDSGGVATFDEVRARALDAVVLVLTDARREADGLAALQKGAHGHYVKGTSYELLNLTLLHALERHRLGAEMERRNRDARGSEAALLLVMESNPDGMVIVDGAGTTRYANRASAQLFGRGAAEMVGKPFPFPLAAGESREVEILKGKGERTTAELRVLETAWRGRRVFLAALRDLTRGAAAEQAVGLAEDRLRAIAAHAPVALVEVDRGMNVAVLAGRRLAALGLKLGDVGRSAADVARQAPRLVEDLRHALGGESYAGLVEVGGVSFDVRCSPLRDKRGEVTGARAVALDVTDVQTAEDAQRAALQRLLETERLRESARARTLRLDLASRELNTPLTPIKMQMHLLRQDASLGEPQRRSLDILERAVNRLARTAQSVLDVARLEAGHLELKREVVDLRTVVSESTEPFADQARARGIHLDVHMPAALWVDVDAGRIGQVCASLVSNALHATPPGGRVSVEAWWEQGACVVRVRDSGVGLSAESMATVFHPRVAAHDAHGEPRTGTGLSLYVAKGIVEQHGGRIWCESPGPGRGSTFSFALPPRGGARPWAGRTGPADAQPMTSGAPRSAG